MEKDKKNFWFTIDRKVLNEALAKVIPIIPSRTPYPIVQNVKIETKDGKLTILATDLDIYVKETVTEANIGSDGVALLPARKLAGILMEIKGEKLTFKVTMNPGYRPGYKATDTKAQQTKTGVIVVYFTDSWKYLHDKPVTAWALRPKSKQIRKIRLSLGRIDKLTYVHDVTLRVDAFARLIKRYAPVDDDYADQAVPTPEAIHIINGSVTSKIPVLDAGEYPQMFDFDWSEPSTKEDNVSKQPVTNPKDEAKYPHHDFIDSDENRQGMWFAVARYRDHGHSYEEAQAYFLTDPEGFPVASDPVLSARRLRHIVDAVYKKDKGKPKPKDKPKPKASDISEPQNAISDMVSPETIDKTLDISEDEKENIMEQEETKPVAMDGKVIALVGDIVVIETTYKGKKKIDVRRLYENGDGAWHPSKQGIRLTKEQWAAIIEAIQAAVAV